jgi:acetyl-CoA carboxylase biotin carboxyl carrier protein
LGEFVDLKQIKELMAAMQRAGMRRISIKEKTGFELELEAVTNAESARQESSGYVPYHHPIPPSFRDYLPPNIHPHTPTTSQAAAPEPIAVKTEEVKEDAQFITSPMVGTFYGASAPDQPSFIKVGDRVDAGTIVCIIEAMKEAQWNLVQNSLK